MDHLNETWLKLEELFNTKKQTAYYGAHDDFNGFNIRDDTQTISFFLSPEKAVQAARNKQGKLLVVELKFQAIKELGGSPTSNHNSRLQLIKYGFDAYINNKYGIVGVVDPKQITIKEIEEI